MKTTKIDLYRLYREEYVAPRKPVLVTVGKARYLAAAGTGAPGGDLFGRCIGALYALAFTAKMQRKKSGGQDYGVAKLECQYLMQLGDFSLEPRESWKWRLLIRTPDFVTEADLAAARGSLKERGRDADTDLVALETVDEGRCVQMLHVGPYDREVDTVTAMARFAAAAGFRLVGPHHEIYLSDPRRVAPERLRTILRIPVADG